MRFFWKVAIPVVCAVMIGGAADRLWIYKAKEQGLTRDAQACRARAEQGDVKAEYELGSRYYYGQGEPKDYAEAIRWYQKSADQSYPTAELALGLIYHLGHGVRQDDAEAVCWYTKGANHGNTDAQNYLAYMYSYGYGVAQDYGQALLWYRRAADQGSAYAETEIGGMYYRGHGVPQDSAQAVNWYRKAADQGYAKGEYNLGFMLYYGKGIAPNLFEARRWFRKAAVQGDQHAVRAIGEGLSPLRKVNLFLQLFGGLLLSTSFLSLNKFEPATGLRAPKQVLNVTTGVLCLISAGVGWYGYTHHEIWPLVYGPNTFTVFARLLDGAILVLLYFVLVVKKPKTGTAAIAALDSTETES
jgi:TPR repeat protein